ncbi:hypothetical protein [Legionella sp. CNM-4043-24]|uniref:hypothetical protein n=1 Tax=Legionella sp. CNM-4043-24 TaxID=3421646 RepID=UPI00403ABA96
MDKNIELYYQSALRLKLPVTWLPDIGFLLIRLGKKRFFFKDTITPLNDIASIYLAKNKYLFHRLLKGHGFSVPSSIMIRAQDFKKHPLSDWVGHLSFPLVVKPARDTWSGRDVLCDIRDIDSLATQVDALFEKYDQVHIEEFHQGMREYRVLVLKNRILGVVERIAAQVTGDGVHSIEQLMTEYYQQRPTFDSSPLIDDSQAQGRIPEPGEIVRLTHLANRAQGGKSISLGKKIHAENARTLIKAARLLGTDLVGFDLLCEDINRPFSQSRWIILEGNFGPGVSIHELPDEGKKMKVSQAVLKQLIYAQPLDYLWHRLKVLFTTFAEDKSHGS